MEYAAIDFEKLNGSPLSVCEVGLVVFKDGKEVEPAFHSYVKPYGEIERNDWAKGNLKHISDEMLLYAPTYIELFPKLQQIIQNKILVVHFKGADLNYVYHMEKQFNLPKLYSKWADTDEIARYLGRCENLPGLYFELFHVPFTGHHNALDDARACGQIFEYFSLQVNIHQFIHEKDYVPSEKKREYNATNTRHTEHGTANVTTDGLLFNYDSIPDCSFFRGKTVVLSGMSVSDNNRIKSILEELGAKCTSSLSGKTNVFITSHVVGPSKKPRAIKLQKEKGLLVVPDDYFWELVKRK